MFVHREGANESEQGLNNRGGEKRQPPVDRTFTGELTIIINSFPLLVAFGGLNSPSQRYAYPERKWYGMCSYNRKYSVLPWKLNRGNRCGSTLKYRKCNTKPSA